MRRSGKRVMVHSANGHRTRKGGNSGAPPDLYTTALALPSTPIGPRPPRIPPRASSVAAGRCPIFDQVFSEELDRVFTETFDLLLGPKTYEMFAASCPTKTKPPLG